MARKQNRQGTSKSLSSNRREAARRRRNVKETAPFSMESLEPRVLLSASWVNLSASGTAPPSGGGAMNLLSNGSLLIQNGSNPPPSNLTFTLTPQASTGSYVNGVWASTGNLNEARLFYSTATLPDGRIFAIGGEYPKFSNTVEIYNPATGVWTLQDPAPTPATNVDLNGAITGASNTSPIVITTSSTVQLQNGMQVTISGVTGNTAANGTYTVSGVGGTTFNLVGSTGNGAYVSGGTWSAFVPQYGDDPIEVLPPDAGHPDGQVLAGYFNSTTTYLFNPAAAPGSQWTTTGSKLYNDQSDEEAWVKLKDGSILTYDVFSSQSGTFQAQRYIPSSGTWVDASALNGSNPPSILSDPVSGSAPIFNGQGSEMGPGFLLPDGRVFYFGANGNTAYYDPTTNQWSAGPNEPLQGGTTQLSATDDPGAMLPNGDILIALSPLGGQPVNAQGGAGGYNFPTPSYIYEFNPVTKAYTDVSPGGALGGTTIGDNAFKLNMIVLPTGQVLLSDENAVFQVFTEDATTGPQDAWRPVISGVNSDGGGVFTLYGTQINGISEGANYGDDNESATNFPIIQLTDSGGNVSYAQTYSWSTTGVATGATPESALFTLPAGTHLSDFTSLTVIANGIASDPSTLVALGSADESVTLRVDPNDSTIIQILSGGVVIATAPNDSADPIIVTGDANNNTVTIDESNGVLDVPITFNGGGSSGAPGDQLNVIGDSGNDSLAVTTGLTGTTDMTFDNSSFPYSFSNIDQLAFDGGAGNDALTIDSTNGLLSLPNGINYDGGTGLNTLQLVQTGGSQTTDTYSVGPNVGQGTSVITGTTGTQTVYFQNLAPVLDTVPAATATVNGTPADNAISYTAGTVVANGLITIDNQESYEFSNKTNLVINGLGGNDVFNLNNPNTPTGLTGTITVNGGDPTNAGADTLVANGIASTPINYAPFGPGFGTVTGAGPVPIFFAAIEQLAINGQGENNVLTVTTEVGFDQVTLIPGAAIDSGSVQITSTATPVSETPLDYSNLGSAGSVNFADGSGGRADTLIYNGTAANDTFTVPAGTGSITLNNQLPVSTPGVSNLVLNGLAGDDTFRVSAGQAYTSITLSGGDPSASDVATLIGDGTLATATMSSLTGQTTVAGGGLGTVTLSGVELVNLNNAGAGGVTVNGTTGVNNAFGVSQASATQTAFTLAGINTTLVANAGAGLLTLDPGAGTTNSVTVNGTAGNDTIAVINGAIIPADTEVTINALQPLNIVTADTASLVVNGGAGDDAFEVFSTFVPVTIPVTYDGGSGNNALILSSGGPAGLAATSDVYAAGPQLGAGSDTLTFAGGTESVNFTNLAPVTDTVPSALLTVNGTNADNAIDYTAGATTALGRVSIDGQEYIDFNNKVTLTIDGLGGNDVFNLNNPNTPTGLTGTITVNGGDPTNAGADTLVANGIASTPINYAPFGPGFGTVTGAGPVPIFFAAIEQLAINGQGENNVLTVTTEVGFDQVTLIPGAAIDSGSVQITSTATPVSETPLDYSNLGSAGSVNFADGSGGRADTLIYNGTAANDTFTVPAGTGSITLNNQLPVSTPGVSNLVLNGLAGDDTFRVSAGQAYTSITLSGGDPSASDVATLIGDGTLATATMNSLTDQTTVVGGGLGSVTLSGVELANLVNTAVATGSILVDGTAVNDAFFVNQVSATQTAFTLAGVNTTLIATDGATGTLTLDPGTGANSVAYAVPAGNLLTTATGGATPTVLTAGFQTLSLVTADTQSLVIAGGAGNDSLTVNSTASPFLIPLTFDGGAGANSLTLTGGTATSDTYAVGPEAGSGNSTIVFAGGTQTVNFANLTPVTDTVVSPSLTVLGTSADNAIGYSVGANATLGRVTIDDQEYVDFNNKTALTINGLGGNDEFTLNNPNTPTGLTSIAVGGNTTAIDTVVANGTSGADAINFAPTSASGGTITGAGPVPITFTTTQQVVINGQGGGDTLTVTTPAGANTINYTPGVAPDAGAVVVDSLVPMNFLNIGATGTVALADAAPARSDTLVYTGTTANDAFGITAAGNITLTGHVTLTSTGANAGLTNVTINGIGGNDTFTVASGNPYANIAINGGPSLNDVATLTGSGVAAAVKMDSATELTTVTGGGLATTAVTLSGVELVNLDNSAVAAGSILVDGTAVNDAFTVNQVDATHTAFALTGFNSTLIATKGATGTLTIDPMGGTNSVTVNGTAAADTINVVNAAGTTLVTVVGFQPLGVTTTDTQALYVSGGLGNDIFNVSGTGGPALTVDGGLPSTLDGGTPTAPTNSDKLNIANTLTGTTTVRPGATPDAGVIVTPDGTTSFLGIENISLTGASSTDSLVVDGTTGDDLIDLYAFVPAAGPNVNTASVNNDAPVTFSSFGPVVLDGISGNDTFNVSPVGLVGVTGITVHGHAVKGGTSEAIVNGSAAADTITVTATSATTATVAIAGSPTTTIDPVSSLVVNGLDGDNVFNVTDSHAAPVGPTPLSAPITLNGGDGNDTFNVGAYTGRLNIDPGQAIYEGQGATLAYGDTINFAGAPGDGAGFGVTINLDETNFVQRVDPNGEKIDLIQPIDNFVGSSFDDKVTVDSSTTPRLINGGLPNKPGSLVYPGVVSPTVTDVLVTGAGGLKGASLNGNYLSRGLMQSGEPIYVDSANVNDILSYDGTKWDLYAGGIVGEVMEYQATVAGTALPKTLATVGNPGYTGSATAAAPITAPNQLAAIPPGDELIVNGEQQFVTITHTNVDSGTVSVFSYAPITFTQIEKIAVVNALGTSGSTTAGVGSGAAPTYTAAVPYATDGRPVSEAVGDINGDGFQDMVVACINAKGQPVVDVFLGTGDGTFTTLDGPGGSSPGLLVESPNYIGGVQVVKLADMNADGKLDIVTLDLDSSVSVLTGNGDGTFNAPVNTKLYTSSGPANGTARDPIAMTIGDLDSDGLPDIVTANYGSASVSVLHNTSSGGVLSFDAMGTGKSQTYKSGGSYPSDVALMDVNGDGFVDILVVNRGTWTVSELWNSSGTPGVFGAPQANPLLPWIPTTPVVFKVNSPIFSIQTQDNFGNYLDFNQDGLPDIMVSTLNGSAATILEGNSTTKTTGLFTVQPQVVYTGTVASAVVSAQAADLNGDGKVDLLLTGRHVIQILLGNGNGTFSSPVAVNLPSQINLGPQKPLIVDLNNDGGLDLLLPDVLTHSINVLLRNLVV